MNDHQTIRVQCKMFAAARQIAGAESVALELPAGAAISDLKHALSQKFPDMAPLLSHAAFAVNEEYVSDDKTLTEEQEIACIPPVSGG